MSRAPTDPEKLAAAIEQLEAERQRREDERIAAGTAIRVPFTVVVRAGEDEAEAIERARALAPLRPEGFHGEVLFDEPELIFTGVPRAGLTPPDWKFEPNPADCAYRPPSPPPIVPASKPPSAPVVREPLEWKKVQTQFGPPDERSCGIIVEGAYAVCGNELHVRNDHEGKLWTVAIEPGDNAEIAARRLLREKFGQHHSFNQPIHYPPRSYH
jgi:hypothetical protein